MKIGKSVGRKGVNQRGDVALIQLLLNLSKTLGEDLAVDGGAGERTFAAIEGFQRKALNMANPDGRIDPHGATLRALLNTADAAILDRTRLPAAGGTRMSAADYARAAKSLSCEVAAIKAVAEVESSGDGFFASGKPKILFEAHVFSRFTNHKYDHAFPDISSKRWNKALYVGGEKEYDRLEKAMLIDRPSALNSASWGRFQIMGFNYALAAAASLESFVTSMFTSEGAHLDAVVAFLKSTGLDVALRNKDWAKFAAGYNGPGYAAQSYDLRLKAEYDDFSKAPKR